MANQFTILPNYPVPLVTDRVTTKDWYFFFAGLFRGLPPGNVEPVTVGASPYKYSATRRGNLIVTGGTVSAIEFSRDGITYYNMGQTSGTFPLSAADIIRITYTVLPTVTFVPT